MAKENTPQKYGYFMYRDASNYKFLFECPIPADLEIKQGEETEIELLGFDLNYFFGNVIKYNFDPNDDHNIVTCEEINDVVTYEDCFFDPNNPQESEQEKEKNVCINLLDSLRKDCNMAISGEWDCSTEEGKEGFRSMIESIDRIQKFISK